MSRDAWSHGSDLACPGPTSGRVWSFTMDAVIPAAAPVDPDALATDADLAFEQLGTRLQVSWRRLRQRVSQLLGGRLQPGGC